MNKSEMVGPSHRSDYMASIFGPKACKTLDVDLQIEPEEYQTAQTCAFLAAPPTSRRGTAPTRRSAVMCWVLC